MSVEGERLASIESKLDAIREDRVEDRTTVTTELAKHSARLDRLERVMWLALGMATASVLPETVTTIARASGA